MTGMRAFALDAEVRRARRPYGSAGRDTQGSPRGARVRRRWWPARQTPRNLTAPETKPVFRIARSRRRRRTAAPRRAQCARSSDLRRADHGNSRCASSRRLPGRCSMKATALRGCRLRENGPRTALRGPDPVANRGSRTAITGGQGATHTRRWHGGDATRSTWSADRSFA